MFVNEIFDSIEGEGKRAGQLATFIRLTGCNLRCSYCDTKYAFTEGKEMNLDDIVSMAHYPRITLTGGEPLLQDVRPLVNRLKNKEINVETNGAIDIEPLFDLDNVFFTVDYKCRCSGMNGRMYGRNFSRLRKRDVLKFVVGSKDDLEEAFHVFQIYKNLHDKKIYVSPVFGMIEPKEIVEFMKEKELTTWKIQLQLHKFIWKPETRGV